MDVKERVKKLISFLINGKASYDLNPRTSLSLSGGAGFNRFRTASDSDYFGLVGVFNTFSERYRSKTRSRFRYGQLDYDHKGKVDGETLKASVSLYAAVTDPRIIGQFDDGGGYTLDNSNRQQGADGNIDWVHPIGKSNILSIGSSFNERRSDRISQSTALGVGGILQFAIDDSYKTRDLTSAAYATYQLKFGKLTVLPGLRLERFDRRKRQLDPPD